MSSWYRERHAGYPLGTVNTTTDAEPEPEPDAPAEPNPLDSMTKAELLEHAQQLGVSPANNDMTKAEIRDAIDAHQEN